MQELLISAINKGFDPTFRLTKEDSIPIVLGMMQKWLREKHNVIIFVDIFLHKYVCIIRKDGHSTIIGDPMLKFDIYEDALEAGLKEGLKLIK